MATDREQRRKYFKENRKKFGGLSWEEFNKGFPKKKPIVNKHHG